MPRLLVAFVAAAAAANTSLPARCFVVELVVVIGIKIIQYTSPPDSLIVGDSVFFSSATNDDDANHSWCTPRAGCTHARTHARDETKHLRTS